MKIMGAKSMTDWNKMRNFAGRNWAFVCHGYSCRQEDGDAGDRLFLWVKKTISVMLVLVFWNLENFFVRKMNIVFLSYAIAWGCCITISSYIGIPEPQNKDVGLLQSYASFFVCSWGHPRRSKGHPEEQQSDTTLTPLLVQHKFDKLRNADKQRCSDAWSIIQCQ